ncbi:MAG: hypothetical protein SGPRY_002967 [Prymnesium sp.]
MACQMKLLLRRILMISLHECGKGVVEFEHERDADSCTGTRHLSAKPIRLKRFEPSEKTPLKRQKRWTFPNRETTTAAENKVVARDTGSTASQESLQTKKGRAETKREKARRLNRVGLSYRCGRCGQPKKGHVCHLAEGETWDGQTAAGVKEPEFDEKPKSLSWDLDSEALFKDIKSVLSKPMTPVSVKGSASEHIYDRPMESDSVVAVTTLKSGRKGELKPSTPAKTSARAALLDQTEKLAALAEIDMEKQRPPSLITPDDADGRVGVPGPSSDMFSPGALKSIMTLEERLLLLLLICETTCLF